ncbi:MAG: formylmethanofuran dehydrogenase subunit A [Planctomycetia bacterium]
MSTTLEPSGPAPAPHRFVIVGGTIHDPLHGRDGVVADIWVENGRIVATPADPRPFTRIDARGRVVMPGGVDLHSHVAGPKVNAGRRIAPHLARRTPAAVPTIHSTGALYAALGYTTVFDAAIATAAAGLAHLELAELPILDKGVYLLAADDAHVVTALDRDRDGQGDREVQRLVAQAVQAGRGWAVKVANPGGPAFWKRGRGDHRDLDTPLPGMTLTGRTLLERLARAVQAVGLPHPLHVHTANLGLPGNWRTLLETMRTFDGIPAHLAHVQFHSYSGGDLDADTFGSGVAPVVEWFNTHPELTLDVGQVLFGDTVAMTGDSAAAEHLAHATGVPWMSHDLHLEGGCGVLPISYREKSLVHAWQWAIGLEWFLTATDPWRVVLSTDHPNGAHFTAYPHLMRLLGDAAFRREAFARIHPAVRKRSPLAGIAREYTLQELCIVTRAAPARIAGLAAKGHLGVGADADITVYRPDRDLSRMFAMPAQVFKAGVLVAEDGEVRALPAGRTLAAAIDRVVPGPGRVR